jgi:hypothetical protein
MQFYIPHRLETSLGGVDTEANFLRYTYHFAQYWPHHIIVSETTYDLNTATKKVAGIYRTHKAGRVIALGFNERIGVIGQTPPVYKISLQSVTAAATNASFPMPSGTILGGASPASGTFEPTVFDLFRTVTLDNPYTTTEGQYVAVVIEYASGGTASGTNYLKVGTSSSPVTTGIFGFPFSLTYDGSNWAKVGDNLNGFAIIYGEASGTEECYALTSAPHKAIGAQEFSVATSGGTYEAVMTLWCQRITGLITACEIPLKFANQNAAFYIKLCSADGEDLTTNELFSVLYYANEVSSNWSTYQNIFLFTPEILLRAGVNYSLILLAYDTNKIYGNNMETANTYVQRSWYGGGTMRYIVTDLPYVCYIGRAGPLIPIIKYFSSRRYN